MGRFDDAGEESTITWEMWEWNVKRHFAGKRGRNLLNVVRDALLAVPGHRLIQDALATKEGEVCAVGAVAAYRYQMMIGESWKRAVGYLNKAYGESCGWETAMVGEDAGLSRVLAWELGYQNDEVQYARTPEQLWWGMYEWVCNALGESPDQRLAPVASV